ncbi:hypothetical protein M231_05585 [Tremella mesenterica]|uniref:SCP domain-containing protein n=1 Tax=Tremella mesenterica TaxID=5217 RepID=A0A4Q1BHR3_TREME|nr:hypothetical protein M231_05585 [Tremella mesenterica]
MLVITFFFFLPLSLSLHIPVNHRPPDPVTLSTHKISSPSKTLPSRPVETFVPVLQHALAADAHLNTDGESWFDEDDWLEYEYDFIEIDDDEDYYYDEEYEIEEYEVEEYDQDGRMHKRRVTGMWLTTGDCEEEPPADIILLEDCDEEGDNSTSTSSSLMFSSSAPSSSSISRTIPKPSGVVQVIVVTSTIVVAPPETATDSAGANPSASSPSGAGGQTQGLDPQAQAFLDGHNIARAKYGAGNVTWSDSLVQRAKANAENCNAGLHTNSGENMASQSGGITPQQAIDMWVNEVSQYDQSNPGFTEATGHFTQVVWKASTTIGCYIATCSPGVLFDEKYGTSFKATCEYDPAGNVVGDNNLYFRENVSW